MIQMGCAVIAQASRQATRQASERASEQHDRRAEDEKRGNKSVPSAKPLNFCLRRPSVAFVSLARRLRGAHKLCFALAWLGLLRLRAFQLTKMARTHCAEWCARSLPVRFACSRCCCCCCCCRPLVCSIARFGLCPFQRTVVSGAPFASLRQKTSAARWKRRHCHSCRSHER